KALRAFAIPVRANSIHGHRSLVIELDDSIPVDVRRAVQGQPKAWQRLRRFQQMAGHTSLNKAARRIGASQSALTTQLGRLERDIGTTLIRRATSDRPMTLTAQGQELLRSLQFPAVSELLSMFGSPPAGWKPDHPLRRRARALARMVDDNPAGG
ncbi:helix-turn-helix domain-containing protein, partial [Catellatospora coxensis]